jgi:large subunit ribosomal protein L24
MQVKKGDKVQVLSGKNKGTISTVIKSFPKLNKVIVEGVNVVKRHQRARRFGKVGQIVEKAMPIDASNVAKA